MCDFLRHCHKTMTQSLKTHCGRNIWKLALTNVIGITALVALYVFLFGLRSLQKFIGKDVIIITHEESMSSILPPGNVVKKKLLILNQLEKLEAAKAA